MATCVTAQAEVPRESVEFFPVNVLLDGAPTNDFSTSVAARGTRPTTWTPATVVGGRAGVMIAGLQPGTYRVWARVSADPESIVVMAGTVVVT